MRLTRKLVYQHFIITSPIEVCLLISLVITHPLIFAQFYWLLMSRGVKLPDRYHAITMAFFLAVFAQYENQCTGYEMNKPISGLLICWLIMSLAERLSSKYHICPQSQIFISQTISHQPEGVYLPNND